MRIQVNGESREVPDGSTVAALLQSLGITQPHVAVELNLEVVPRAHHRETILRDGDRLEVVTLVGGAGALFACGGDDASSSGSSGTSGGTSGTSGTSGDPRDGSVLEDGAVAETPACKAEGGTAAVQAPTFVRNVKTGETGWFASPAVVDLDKDGKNEIVAALPSCR